MLVVLPAGFLAMTVKHHIQIEITYRTLIKLEGGNYHEKDTYLQQAMVVFLAALLPVHGLAQPMDFGDAPEGALAYPSMGVMGFFPTCITVGPLTWIQHTNFGAWFGPAVDFELDGNAGLCPTFGPYDADECFHGW